MTTTRPVQTYRPGDRVRLLTEAEREGTVAAPPDLKTAAFVGVVVSVTQHLDHEVYSVEMDARTPRDARPVSATVPASYLEPWPRA